MNNRFCQTCCAFKETSEDFCPDCGDLFISKVAHKQEILVNTSKQVDYPATVVRRSYKTNKKYHLPF